MGLRVRGVRAATPTTLTLLLLMNPNSQSAQGLLTTIIQRLMDLRDWLDRVPLPPEYNVDAFTCHIHSDGLIKPSLELCVSFPHYKDALSWAYLHCKHHDLGKGVDGREISQDHGCFVMSMIDFKVRCAFPSETYPASLLVA
jgi:hypothetical protein